MRLIGELFFTLLWATSLSLTALFLATRMLWVGLGVTPAELLDTLRARGLVLRTLVVSQRSAQRGKRRHERADPPIAPRSTCCRSGGL